MPDPINASPYPRLSQFCAVSMPKKAGGGTFNYEYPAKWSVAVGDDLVVADHWSGKALLRLDVPVVAVDIPMPGMCEMALGYRRGKWSQ